ncbi:MAG TPA: UDP-N-acetylmuramate--L-alanine ligase [Acidimicrobiales bacterium]
MARLDLSQPQRIHIVGIGGAGMSAIATVLAAMGHEVTGSDLAPSASLERLRPLGVAATVGHDAAHVGSADIVTASTAIPPTNVEVVEARRRGLPTLSRAETLAAITETRRTIAVAGTHGKTTTASMLALILIAAGMDPSFIVGGEIKEVGSGAAWAGGEWLIVEADESDGTFLELQTEVAVVTSVEPDHLDHYGSVAALEDAFATFLARAGRIRIVCADDEGASRVGQSVQPITYGTSDRAGYRMMEVVAQRRGTEFAVEHRGTMQGRITVPVAGLHNARNACSALVAALVVGAPFAACETALARYGGVGRRFELRGERDGITYIDDYAHLPGEVRPVLAAARQGGWERTVVVFQPHRFSRTAALWKDFADAFEGADVLVVTDIYPAGEAPRPGVSGRLVFEAVTSSHPSQTAVYLPERKELVDYLRAMLRPGDLCLTLGAGDLTLLPDELLADPMRQ